MIMQGVMAITGNLQDLIKPWDSQIYRQLWELDKDIYIKRYAITKKNTFSQDISRYKEIQSEVAASDTYVAAKFIRVDFGLLKQSLINHCLLWQQKLINLLHINASSELSALNTLFVTSSQMLKILPVNLEQLSASIGRYKKLVIELPTVEARFEPLEEMYKLLLKFDVLIPVNERDSLASLRADWADFTDTMKHAESMLHSAKLNLKKDVENTINSLLLSMVTIKEEIKNNAPFEANDDSDIAASFRVLSEFSSRVEDNRHRAVALSAGLDIFDIPAPSFNDLDETEKTLECLRQTWSMFQQYADFWKSVRYTPFSKLALEDLDIDANRISKLIIKLSKSVTMYSNLL